jgi:hypothetical protein
VAEGRGLRCTEFQKPKRETQRTGVGGMRNVGVRAGCKFSSGRKGIKTKRCY